MIVSVWLPYHSLFSEQAASTLSSHRLSPLLNATMVKYEVVVTTANLAQAATTNNIFIKLVGIDGESKRTWLKSIKGAAAFLTGTVSLHCIFTVTVSLLLSFAKCFFHHHGQKFEHDRFLLAYQSKITHIIFAFLIPAPHNSAVIIAVVNEFSFAL